MHQAGDTIEAQRLNLLAHGIGCLDINRAFATGLDLNFTGYQRVLALTECGFDLIITQYLPVYFEVRCTAVLQNTVI
ncbi:hypothetical protein NUBL21990_43550 [Klebsiella pneumoniae]|nr:hypothetical protein NUBL21990_43550 [Klebsiella pneumoniae]